jgi:hypothetical protein
MSTDLSSAGAPTPTTQAIAALGDKKAAAALYPGTDGYLDTNILTTTFGGDKFTVDPNKIPASQAATSDSTPAKPEFDFGNAISTYGQQMKSFQLKQAQAEADYKDALRHTTAAFATKQPNIYKANLQKKADAEYIYNAMRDKQADLTNQMAIKHGLAPNTLAALANEDPAKINHLKKNYIETGKAPDFGTASTMFNEDIKRGNKNGDETPVTQAIKNLQTLQGTVGSIGGDEYFQAQGLLKDAHDQVYNATLSQKANELGALQKQYSDAVNGNSSADQVTALRSVMEAKQKEITALQQAKVATQRSYTGGTLLDQFNNSGDKNEVKTLWPKVQGFAKVNSNGGFTIPSDPAAAAPVLQQIVETSQKLPPRSPILVNGNVIASNPNYTVNDLQAQFVGSGKQRAPIAPATGWAFGEGTKYSDDNPHAKSATEDVPKWVPARAYNPNGYPAAATPDALTGVTQKLEKAKTRLEYAKKNDITQLPGTLPNILAAMGSEKTKQVALANAYEEAKRDVDELTAQKQDLEARLGVQNK